VPDLGGYFRDDKTGKMLWVEAIGGKGKRQYPIRGRKGGKYERKRGSGEKKERRVKQGINLRTSRGKIHEQESKFDEMGEEEKRVMQSTSVAMTAQTHVLLR